MVVAAFPQLWIQTAQVLVETYEAGEHISRYVREEPGSPISSRLAELGSQAMLKMMLIDNLIHSDLHPGNILVRLDPPRLTQLVTDRTGWQVRSSLHRAARTSFLPSA